MSIKVNFEIGHEASIRTKRTPEGFTHDWEVFVRGVEGADISQFVDKVIFQLHETFPKPKRVVKEAPYCVKQSGYAGFIFPIEIHLKNRDEPKKISFNYDLHLQHSGTAIIKVQKEKYVFTNPSDDFKRKLLKGGGMIVANPDSFLAHVDHERDSRDSFADDKPSPQLIGKPKLGGDASSRKHKPKDDLPRPSPSFVNLFGPPIHKTSRVSPDLERPSPNPKLDKKDKEKSVSEKDKMKPKHELKDKEYRDEKSKMSKEEKERPKEEKRPKSHKERDSGKEKSSKRPGDRPLSPVPPAKRPLPTPVSLPVPVPPIPTSPVRTARPHDSSDHRLKQQTTKSEKKSKKDKKSHEKDRDGKKDHKKLKESKTTIPSEPKDPKPKDSSKDIPPKINPVPKEKEKPLSKPEKPVSKYLIEMKPKDMIDSGRLSSDGKRKDKGDRERKHKHKKKDKKRDESREKKDSSGKEKKRKHEKHSSRDKSVSESKDPPPLVEKVDPGSILREIDKVTPPVKSFKEKDRSQSTISPISLDTGSPSSSRSASKSSKNINALSSMIDALSCSSSSESEDVSIMSDDDDDDKPPRDLKQATKTFSEESVRPEPAKTNPVLDASRSEKRPDKLDKSLSSAQKLQKAKDKTVKRDSKEEKKQRKRKSSSKVDEPDNVKVFKGSDDSEHAKSKRSDSSNSSDVSQRVKTDQSPRMKSDTKVQDDGVSSSLSDHAIKCESPIADGGEPTHLTDRKPISPDYMTQLKELQRRIMTIQSNEELERVVNLIAETGKFEVTKKTFDFDLCLLDRSTVQQLQELIGCESRA